MFAIIKNGKLSGFTDVEITKENMIFDELIEGDFDVNGIYNYIDGELIRDLSKEIQKINSETRDKILSRYSETDQTNLERKASRIIGVAFYEKRDFTADEVIILNEVMNADDFINQCISEGEILKNNLYL